MNRTHFSSALRIAAAAFLGGAIFTVALPAQEPQVQTQPEFKLPPGWTEADMQAMIAAGTPGRMHDHLAKGVGAWECKGTMWMSPDTPPMQSSGTMTLTPVMDGRYFKCEIVSEVPGMGTYLASGIYGYDNVQQKFVANFIDNHSTGIMTGTGELSPDGKTLTWTYTHTCPITKKPAVVREVETVTGPDARTLVAWGADPKSGKEFKMMSIELTRKKTGE